VTRQWQAPSALVCNAGFSPKGPAGRVPLAEIDLAEWNDVLAVNLTGALLCCQSVLPAMVQRQFGRIVLIGSLAGRTMPRIASAGYVAAKSALAGLARSIVSEYSRHGITANTICPGRIITEMTGPAEMPANQAALERIPLGRLGTPEDIARVVEFVLRLDSGFINGAIIDVNGGEFTPA
jgi:3-oxoacyl-[acyl-carrier protein] reductase